MVVMSGGVWEVVEGLYRGGGVEETRGSCDGGVMMSGGDDMI